MHAAGARAAFPLVTVNCAAITETLLESELFGHSRGSFTGAYHDRAGVLGDGAPRHRLHGRNRRDEPAHAEPAAAPSENGEIQRIGTTKANARVDVRVIAATNRRDLLQGVLSKTFREVSTTG